MKNSILLPLGISCTFIAFSKLLKNFCKEKQKENLKMLLFFKKSSANKTTYEHLIQQTNLVVALKKSLAQKSRASI